MYTGEYGQFAVKVCYQDQEMPLLLVVARKALLQDWNTIICLYDHSLYNLLQRYSGVFREGLGGFKAKLFKACPFPYTFAHRSKPKSI